MSAFAMARLVGLSTSVNIGFDQTQASNWNYAIFKRNGEWAVLPHLADKAGLVMCSSVGWECVVDASHNIKRYMFFIATCKSAFFNVLSTRIRTKTPISDADVARERFAGQKSKPGGGKWLITDLTASPLLLLRRGRATVFHDDKPRLGGNIYGWAGSSIGYFERDRDASSIHIDSEPTPAKPYQIGSYPCSLCGNQCLFGHIGGFFSGDSERFICGNHFLGLFTGRFHFIQLCLHDRQLVIENRGTDNASRGQNDVPFIGAPSKNRNQSAQGVTKAVKITIVEAILPSRVSLIASFHRQRPSRPASSKSGL